MGSQGHATSATLVPLIPRIGSPGATAPAPWPQEATTAMATLAALLAGSVVIDLLFFTGFIASDDILYTTAARRLAETGALWPDLAPHEARLLMIGWCALVGWLVGQDVQAIAASFVVFHQTVNLLTFCLGRQLGGARVGVLAAALTATFPLMVVFSTTILPDIPVTACFLAAFVAFHSAYAGVARPRRSVVLLTLSGGALGLAFLVKESGLVPLPLFLALALVHEWRMRAARGGLRGGLARVAAFLAGLGLVLALDMSALRFLTGMGSFRLGSFLAAPTLATPSLGSLARRAVLMAATVGARAPSAAVIAILLAAGAYTGGRRGYGTTLLFPAWFAAYYTWGTTSLATYSPPSLQLRYFIPCVPFLLVTVAGNLADAYSWAAERARRIHPRMESWTRAAAAIGGAALAIVQLARCDRDAGNLYGAALVSQSLRAVRSWSSGNQTPLVISESLGAQLFPLFRHRPDGLLFSHEVRASQLEQWRREGGFHFLDLHPTSPLGRAELNPLLVWRHGLPASEHRVESLVESLLSGRGTDSRWMMRPLGRFDRVGTRSAELRVLLGDPDALSRLRHRPDRGVLVYQLTGTDQDVRYPQPPVDPREATTIVNGAFDQWSEAGPLGWQARDTAASRVQGPAGHPAVRIGPGAFGYLWQSRRLSVSARGRRLVLRATVRSDAPAAAQLWIKVAIGPDWEEVFGNSHPGDGTWRPLEAALPVPPGFAGGEVRIVLLHAGREGHSEFADLDVSVR
jgi:4-amino-4-deoxy-L-arabinose transferase-like glycosyltransferase